MNAPMQLSRSATDAFDLLANPIWVFSLETLAILATNDAVRTWLGFSTAEFEKLTVADLRPPEERAELRRRLAALARETDAGGLWTIVAKSGDRFRVYVHWRTVSLEGSRAVVATLDDRTEFLETRRESSDLAAQVERLREQSTRSELNFRSIFEASPGKMIVVRPRDFSIVAVTKEYAQSTMTLPAEIYGRSIFEVFPDDPADPQADGVEKLRASFEKLQALSSTDIMSVLRYPIRRPNGLFEERFWMIVNKPVFDDADDLAYIVHRVEDVTDLVSGDSFPSTEAPAHTSSVDILLRLAELKSTLTAREESDARLRTAERLLDLGAWEYHFETKSMHWSTRTFDIYGVSGNLAPPDLEAYLQLVHPGDRRHMIDVYNQFEQTGAEEIVFQHRIQRSDGSIAYIKGVGERHVVDGREIVIGFVLDISEAVTSQSRLAEMMRLQQIAGEMAKLGSWKVELHPPRMFWSPETAAIHEEPAEIAPTFDEAVDYYAPEHREQIRSAFAASIAEGRRMDETLQLVTAKGNRRWVRAIGEPVRDEKGQVTAVQGAFQDISELVAARDEASGLASRLHQTLESISDAFILIDERWHFVFVNSRAELLLQRGRHELLGKSVWTAFPEAVGSTFESEYRRAVAEQQSVRFDEYFPPLAKWFSVDAHPTSEGLAVYFRDVTNERARESQLRLLEAAVSRQGDILLITEAEPIDAPDGPKIVYVNEAFVRRTGYRPEEVIGLTPRVLQGPATDRAELNRIRRSLEKWQPVRAELINYTKGGDAFWLEIDIVPLADETGWYTHWVSVERDISDRKRIQQEMQVNDERFKLVATATSDVVWDWDLVNNTVWWNENLRRVFGYDHTEIEPGPESRINHIHPDDRRGVLDSLRAVIESSETHWSREYRFMHRDGHLIIVVDRGFVIRDADGRALRMLGSMLNMTQYRDLESQLRQSQKLEAVGQLTGGIAHDFNNLLTVILGNSELLCEDLTERPDLRPLAEMTLSAAQRGAEMTKRLLSFARKQALEPTVVDLNELIAGVEPLLRRTLGEQIDIKLVRAGRLWPVEVDQGQLETALLNLAINARDAMPDGGCLTIETANVALDDEYVASSADIEPGQYAMLSVSDTGHGIPRDIIEPFFTTKPVGKGSGLGLSMVYGFVKQSGGQVRVYSEPDDGTSIKLYFPRAYGSNEAEPAVRLAPSVDGGHERILVVEDEPSVREHLCNQLKRLGYGVLSASSGSQALAILEQQSDIDLLLTDVVMPGMNGRELADRALALRPLLRILFTSGYTENAIVHRGRLDSGVELLHKPYRRDQLAEKLRKVLKGS